MFVAIDGETLLYLSEAFIDNFHNVELTHDLLYQFRVNIYSRYSSSSEIKASELLEILNVFGTTCDWYIDGLDPQSHIYCVARLQRDISVTLITETN